jgi:hypothetical protein
VVGTLQKSSRRMNPDYMDRKLIAAPKARHLGNSERMSRFNPSTWRAKPDLSRRAASGWAHATVVLLLALSELLAVSGVRAQAYSIRNEFPVPGTAIELSVLEHAGQTWIMVGTFAGVYYSRDGGSSWVVDSFQAHVTDIEVVGDSMFVLATYPFGLYRLAPSDDRLVFLGNVGHSLATAVAEASDGSLISGGENGVSRSVDGGNTWSAVDPIFSTNYPAQRVLIGRLGQGVTVARAAVGIALRLFYSYDQGRTWSDSSSAPIGTYFLPDVVYTPSHVEMHVGDGGFFARTTWDAPLVPFGVSPSITSAVFEPSFGVLVSTVEGLWVLDERSMSLVNLFPDVPLAGVAAAANGRLFVSKSNAVLELVATSTSVDASHRHNDLSVFPNPASSEVVFQGSESGTRYQVFDAIGRAVHAFTGGSGTEVLSTAGLAPGLYFVVSDLRGPEGTFVVVD